MKAIAPPSGALAGALGSLRVPVHPLTIDRRNEPPERWIRTLAEIASELRLDVLHGNTLSVADLVGPAAAEAGIVGVSHVREIERIKSGAKRGRLAHNARLIAVSHAVKDNLVAEGLPTDLVSVVYNGIDTELWSPERWADAGRALREAEPPCGALLLGVGQIGMRKGPDLLIEAVARMERPVELWWAGERWSAKDEAVAFETSLRARAAEIERPDRRVRFLGYRDDVPALMCAADEVVHPARQEPLSRVVLEAMAMGCDITATNVGGTRELFGDPPVGFLVPPDDVEALAGAIEGDLEWLSKYPSEVGPAARARCLETFSDERSAMALAAIYDELLA